MEDRIKTRLTPEFATAVYRTIYRIHQSDMTAADKVQNLYRLISMVQEELTQDERIHFTTQFARTAYIGSRFDLKGVLLFGLHHLRKRIETSPSSELKQLMDLSMYCATHLIQQTLHQAIPPQLNIYIPKQLPVKQKRIDIQKFEPFLRVTAVKFHKKNTEIEVLIESPKVEKKILVIDREDRNMLFSTSLKRLMQAGILPLNLHLLNTEVDQQGKLHPQAIILDPDYLMDVTAIANCFKEFGSDPRVYLLQKFMPKQTNIHLMIGHIANFILDEIINQPQIEFQEIKQKLFKLDPLGFSLFEDKLIREIIQRIQLHFVHLKKVVLRDFTKVGIKRSAIYLEPSFYSPRYGIQGRLDVFHQKHGEQTDIVELKSGKVFRPNAYGLNQNHYVQTILYDLLVKETVKDSTRITSYILYSVEESRNLRFAPALQSKQFEALAVRNAMVETDLYLAHAQLDWVAQLMNSYQLKYFPKISGFLKRDIKRFEKAYQSLNDLEKEYFNAFVGFTFSELRMAKTGSDDIDQLNGMAGLWMNTEQTKMSQFALLNHLKIIENIAHLTDPVIVLEKTSETAALSKFRVGDIVVFYPDKAGYGEVRSSQVFKSTLVEITENQLTIRLRSIQKNQTIFNEFDFWNIEADFMESSFNGMFRGLFQFAEASQSYRDLILTKRPPEKTLSSQHFTSVADLNTEQQEIYQQILSSEDYYLLWGPPGTGKTSRMIKNIIAYLMAETDECIMVMAYTNRAVDELCAAILSIGPPMRSQVLRIGSHYSVAEKYQPLLLSQQIEELNSRSELVSLLKNKRIICGTLASIIGKQDLFALKKFDRVIIDEASQILEPLLVGLLTHFPKRILVGDHLQLPAVVAQPENVSTKLSRKLEEISLASCRNSMFERLYRRCQEENWEWAIGQLSKQGRMHQDIMQIPNRMFYDGKLSVIQGVKRLIAPLDMKTENEQLRPLTQHRLIYIPTTIDESEIHYKTNLSEARAVVRLMSCFMKLKKENSLEQDLEHIGVITPFRAQIARIKHSLTEAFGEMTSTMTVDTVERYQGGARDVIILSFCVNHKRQLRMIQSLSQNGTDRKLNVALTRAREQIILLGNENILRHHKQISQLISQSYRWDDFGA